jgi:type VI secretion system secreted protein VgrG
MFSKRTTRLRNPLLPEDQLFFKSLKGREALSGLHGYRLEALSPDPNLPIRDLLGQSVCVEIGLPLLQKRYIHQHITHIALGEEEGQYLRYTAELRPWLWFLTQNSNWKVFQRQSTIAILKQIFADYPMAVFEDRTSKTYPERRYCVQAGESDAQFVMRLMEQEGIYFFFEHTANHHIMILADDISAHESNPVAPTLPFKRTSAAEDSYVDLEHFSVWHSQQAISNHHVITNDYDYFQPAANLEKQKTPEAGMGSRLMHGIYQWGGQHYERGRGEHFAEVKQQAARAQEETAQGAGPIKSLACGQLFNLSKHLRDDQNQCHLVTSADFEIEENTYESAGQGQSKLWCSVSVQPANTPFRPQANTPKPCIQGVQTAVVVGPPGQELHTDSEGRIKVQFHWDRLGQKNQQSSCWVRVASPWAGQGWGAVSTPRIGQEVLVSFIDGDPDRPIVTGSVYNALQPAPFHSTQSGLISRSTPGGSASNANMLRFEDKKGSEEMFIQAEKNLTQVVKKDETKSVANNKTLLVDGSSEEVIKKGKSVQVTEGNLAISSDKGVITLSAKTEIVLQVGNSKLVLTPDNLYCIASRVDLNP